MELTATLSNARYQVTNKIGNFEFKADEPRTVGGDEQYPQPTSYLLAALGSCLVVTIQAMAKIQKVTLSHLSVKVEGELQSGGLMQSHIQNKFLKINIIFNIKSDLSDDAKNNLLLSASILVRYTILLKMALNLTGKSSSKTIF